MNKHHSRIRSLRKEILDTERKLREISSERTHKLRVLSRVNRDYDLGKISYAEYSEVWSSTLNRYSVEELISGYDSWTKSLEERKKALESEIADIRRDQDQANRALSVSLSLILVFGMIVGLSMFGTEIRDLTGFATSETAATTGEAIINAYYAIQLSNNTIAFGTIQHNTSNNSAVENRVGASASDYYINVSNDSNVDVDVNISANNNLELVGSSFVIGVGNLSWASDENSTSTKPGVVNETSMSTTPTLTTDTFNSVAGDVIYYRFWIDIPYGQPAGTYNNSITLEAYRE